MEAGHGGARRARGGNLGAEQEEGSKGSGEGGEESRRSRGGGSGGEVARPGGKRTVMGII